MNLSLEQESNLLQKYEPFLEKKVQAFMRAAGNTTVEYEDLLQEARLSFLTHIRRIDNEDKICSCSYALLRAMYKHCVEMAPIHIPLNRFRQEIKEVSVLPLDSLSDVESGDSFEDEVESRLMTENFWNSLSDTDRKILDSKMQGRKGQDVVHDAGVCSEAYVSKRFSIMRQKFYDQMGDA